MEETEIRTFRFPSGLPGAMTGRFPDWEDGMSVTRAADVSKVSIGTGGTVRLFNPPAELIRTLPETLEIHAAFDELPPSGMIHVFRKARVIVPSLAFRSVFRRHGVEAELVHPDPRSPERIEERRKMLRRTYKIPSSRVVAWADERLLSPSFQPLVLEVLRQAVKGRNNLTAVWVSERADAGKHGLKVLKAREVDREKGWLAADLVITATSVRRSLVPVHLPLLAANIAVFADEGGDHAEWVNHLFTGAVIGRKTFLRELRHYLEKAVRDPAWLEGLKHNAGKMAQHAVREV
ncbi:hypothetical protein [Staphylospora marina]|uniref:hypothetical protein n=1 Tax=Staphylospora marina TaxID=2490858 RepID=UPI000F5BA38A|nr:hypothetical protein [Staphylospora marina]